MPVKQNTVVLRATTPVLAKEGIAGEAGILPGHLIAGPDAALTVHKTEGGAARKAFAVEYFPDKEINDAYAKGDEVVYVVFKPGEEVLALVAAGAAAIAEGDALESAGDGTLQKHDEGEIIAYARQSVDNAGGAEAARIAVEVA